MTFLSLIGKKKDVKSGSLDRMVWRRLCHNPLAVTSMVVIGFFAVVAVLGYLITPDPTPFSNQQYLELATLKPGSKATFLCVGDTVPLRRNMIKGTPLPYTAIPIESYERRGDSIYVQPVAGAPMAVAAEGTTVKERTFVLGTDPYGRDVLSMIMIGSRVSLSVGFIAILIALLVGITLGPLGGPYPRCCW